jgi:hypothetical protein
MNDTDVEHQESQDDWTVKTTEGSSKAVHRKVGNIPKL